MNLPSLLPAIAGLFACSLVTLLAAAVMTAVLRIKPARVAALAVIILWASVTALLVMLAGLAGRLSPAPLWIACLAGAALITGFCRSELRAAWAALATVPASLRGIASGAPVLAGVVGVAWLLILARVAVHTWYLSPYVYDALTYHLPKVADWIQQGRLVAFDTPVTRSYWPANFELLQAWFSVFLHRDTLIELAGVPFYCLGVLSVYSISRALGARPALALAGATAFALTPSFLQNAISCKNDIAIAALYLSAIALMVDRPANGGEARGARFILLVLALALAAGTKPSIAFLAPGLAIPALWWLRGRWERKPAERPPRLSPVFIAVVLVMASLLAGYWYARNAALFGNPFHPSRPRAWTVQPAGKASPYQQERFRPESIGGSLQALLTEKIRDRHEPFNPELPNMAGWGWFVIAPGVLFLLRESFRSPPVRLLFAGFAISLLSLFGWVTPDAWNLRFALWFPAIFAIAFATGMEALPGSVFRSCHLLIAAACCALNLIGTLDTGYNNASRWRSLLRTPVDQRVVPTGHEYLYKHIRPGERFAYRVGDNHWVYPLYGPGFSRFPLYVPEKSAAGIAARMREQGLTFLFLETEHVPKMLLAELSASPEFRHVYGSIYALKSPSNP